MSGTYPATMHFLQSRKEYEKACLSVARLCIIKESFAREIMAEAENGSQISIDPDPVGLTGFVEIGDCLCKMMPEIIGERLILWTGNPHQLARG